MNRTLHRSCWTLLAGLVLTNLSVKTAPATEATRATSHLARQAGESQATQASKQTDATQHGKHSDIVAQAERGITGTWTFTYHGAGPGLRPKIQRDADAPLIVRLQPLGQPNQYEARFIGNMQGVFDLRDTLEHTDGSVAVDLPPMIVNIVSTLPKDQRSDLFEAAAFQPSLSGGYRVGLVMAIFFWLSTPLIVTLVRILCRPEVAAAATMQPPPTLADQLKPLVEAAASRALSTPEKGRLELLLVHYWRQRAGLPSLSMASSIQQLRDHPEAGPLLSAMEEWLHSSTVAPLSSLDLDRSPEAILKLLQPYQSVAAIDPEDLPMVRGSL